MILRVHIHFFRAFKVLIFLTRGWLEIFSYLKECLIPPKILETVKEVCKKCPYLVPFFENNILKKCFYLCNMILSKYKVLQCSSVLSKSRFSSLTFQAKREAMRAEQACPLQGLEYLRGP